MLFKEYLTNRKSTREYSEQIINTSHLKMLEIFAKEVVEEFEPGLLQFQLFEDGKNIYSKLIGRGGYSGVMIESPHYFGIKMMNLEKETRIKAAYAMQALLKKAFELGIGTCWIDIENIPHSLELELAGSEDKIVNYLFALGYPKEKKFFDFKTIVSSKTGVNKFDIKRELRSNGSSRLSIEEIVYLDTWGNNSTYETLENWGLDELFYELRNAPSNMNKQPWRFILDNDVIRLCIIDPENEANLTDAGIMMFLFEGIANDMGMKQKWNSNLSEIREYKGNTYQIIATFDM